MRWLAAVTTSAYKPALGRPFSVMLTAVDDPGKHAAVIAWVDAMDAACAAVCHRRGRPPLDPTSLLGPAEFELAWEATAALAAGLVRLGAAAAQGGVGFEQFVELARREHEESLRRPGLAAVVPAARQAR